MSKGLLKGDRDALERYIRDLADLMGLRDWDISLTDAPPDDADAHAEIHVYFGQKRADISFSPEWSERSAKGLQRTVCHELVHCHLWSMDQRLDDLCGVLGQAAYTVASNAMKESLELAVDGISTAWANVLPLPDAA